MRRRSVLAAMTVGMAMMADRRIEAMAAPGTATPQSGETLEMVVTRMFDAPVAPLTLEAASPDVSCG